jgi:hypothetical protein
VLGFTIKKCLLETQCDAAHFSPLSPPGQPLGHSWRRRNNSVAKFLVSASSGMLAAQKRKRRI